MSKFNGFSFEHEMKLLPCPFCFSNNLIFNKYSTDGWIECSECECQGPHDHLADVFLEKCENNAIDLWNDRE